VINYIKEKNLWTACWLPERSLVWFQMGYAKEYSDGTIGKTLPHSCVAS
jgi:hypothetical protein